MASETVSLRPMSETDYANYVKHSASHYAEEMSRAEDLTIEEATAAAEESFAKLLPDGFNTANVWFFFVVDPSERTVGSLWFSKRTNPKRESKPYAWLCDITLNEEARGKGYGRQLMQLLEVEVKKTGLTSLGLHVFGHNKVAAGLYEKSGFRVTNMIMRKDLGD